MSSLYEASLSGNAKEVTRILAEDKTLDIEDLNLALDTAIGGDHFSVVELLLKNGASATSEDDMGCNPITAAYYSKNEKIMDLLVAHGASKDDINMDYIERLIEEAEFFSNIPPGPIYVAKI